MLSHLGLNQAPIPVRVHLQIVNISQYLPQHFQVELNDNLGKVFVNFQKNYRYVFHFYDVILKEVLLLAK